MKNKLPKHSTKKAIIIGLIGSFAYTILIASMGNIISSLFEFESIFDSGEAIEEKELELFSSKIYYVPYTDYVDLESDFNVQFPEKYYTDGMRELLTHTFDKYTRVEVVVICLDMDDPVQNVHVKLTEYKHENYAGNIAYRPDQLSDLVLSIDKSIITPQDLNLKTFTSNRVIAIPLSITTPIINEVNVEAEGPDYFNLLPRIALSCHVDTENEIIGVIEYECDGKVFTDDILEMKTARVVEKIVSPNVVSKCE